MTFPTPSQDAIKHSQALIQQIKILGETISFHDYMRAVLYSPLGYYSAGSAKFGEAGDFITAPECSSLFGKTLAHAIMPALQKLDTPIVFELGAGSGKLAGDILTELNTQNNLPNEYWILEPSADLQARQQIYLQTTLPAFFDHIHWLSELPKHDFEGVILGNEVVDALPVHRFEIDEQGDVFESMVDTTGDTFTFSRQTADAALIEKLKTTPLYQDDKFHGPHVSETNLELDAWIKAITEHHQKGQLILIDYGYEAAQYYAPHRHLGTLMCYYRHQAHSDVFMFPGLQDITAHVNFTALGHAAMACGYDDLSLGTQAEFLVANGIEQHVGSTPNLETQNALRRLVHPKQMGEMFKVMSGAKNLI